MKGYENSSADKREDRAGARKPHPPKTPLEKGMVGLAKKFNLKSISSSKNKRK